MIRFELCGVVENFRKNIFDKTEHPGAMVGFDSVRQEDGQRHRQEEMTVQNAQHDDQEDGLEKGDDHRHRHPAQDADAEHGRQTAEQYRIAEQLQRPDRPLRGGPFGTNVTVGDVSGQVDREADRHDQRDHRDAVQIDIPVGHVAVDADVDRQHGQIEVRYQDESDDDHAAKGDAQIAPSGRRDAHVLVDVGPEFVVSGHVHVCILGGGGAQKFRRLHLLGCSVELEQSDLKSKSLDSTTTASIVRRVGPDDVGLPEWAGAQIVRPKLVRIHYGRAQTVQIIYILVEEEHGSVGTHRERAAFERVHHVQHALAVLSHGQVRRIVDQNVHLHAAVAKISGQFVKFRHVMIFVHQICRPQPLLDHNATPYRQADVNQIQKAHNHLNGGVEQAMAVIFLKKCRRNRLSFRTTLFQGFFVLHHNIQYLPELLTAELLFSLIIIHGNKQWRRSASKLPKKAITAAKNVI
ncbi:hypothetical protein Tsp_00431 [Trichinella spiralis]|uniref:hypothetical protein n=1 Tax=Trichinella spiralis TaxID=6334 RepID=UPI0001EFB4A6|nr:hypothetical protein Tsp_00431 [Trichinella spiralis]